MKEKFPKHIAIIMDGNGRWALSRKLPRIRGHETGVKVVKDITKHCALIGLKYLTLYAFSAENWKRPKREVNFLMRLLKKYLIKERDELMKNNIIFRVVGRIAELPEKLQDEININIELTKNNTGLTLCLALNYGGRQEIVDSVKKIYRQIKNNKIDINDLTDELISRNLYAPDMPEPDMVIRTGGEIRLSNFLLWQTNYSELWITKTFWPEFTSMEMDKAINDYSKRNRRYGGL